MDSKKGPKKNKKQYYKKAQIEGKRSDEIEKGLTGFFVTCDKNKEKRCLVELYNILNETVDTLYPNLAELITEANEIEESKSTEAKPEDSKEDDVGVLEIKRKKEEEDKETATKVESISDMIEKELKSIKEGKQKYFYNFDTGVNCIIFIKIDPRVSQFLNVNVICQNVVKRIKDSQAALTRFCARFLPVICTKAKLAKFQEFAKVWISKYFEDKGEGFTWVLEYKCRNNNSCKRDEFMEVIKEELKIKNAKPNLSNAQYTMIVEIVRDLLFFSIIPGYKDNCKYNLQMLSTKDLLPRDHNAGLKKSEEEERIGNKEETKNADKEEEKSNGLGENKALETIGKTENEALEFNGEPSEKQETNVIPKDSKIENPKEEEEDEEDEEFRLI